MTHPIQYERRGSMLYAFHKEPGRAQFLCECGDAATASQLLADLTIASEPFSPHSSAASVQTPDALLQELVSQFESEIGQDEPINGGDAVDYLSEFVPRARQALIQQKRSSPAPALPAKPRPIWEDDIKHSMRSLPARRRARALRCMKSLGLYKEQCLQKVGPIGSDDLKSLLIDIRHFCQGARLNFQDFLSFTHERSQSEAPPSTKRSQTRSR